ncbi:hypothetical protein HDV00_004983 [Rhizophlyctis rosea]|nr:hypothetical protein HDV00_004983 [Rhizophlyctis rosea]
MSLIESTGHQEHFFLSDDDAALVFNANLVNNQYSTAASHLAASKLDFDLFGASSPAPVLESCDNSSIGNNHNGDSNGNAQVIDAYLLSLLAAANGDTAPSSAIDLHHHDNWLGDCFDHDTHFDTVLDSPVYPPSTDFMPVQIQRPTFDAAAKKDHLDVATGTTDISNIYPSPQETPATQFAASPSEAASPLFDPVSPTLSVREAASPLFASLDEIHPAPPTPTALYAQSPLLINDDFNNPYTTTDQPTDQITVPLTDFTSLLSKLVRPIPLADAPQPPIRSAGRRRPSKVYPCPAPGCSKTFTRRFNLETHLRTHDANRERPFPCADCEKTFVRVHDLDRHRSVHAKEKVHLCPGEGCGKRFTRKDALRRHQKTSGCVEVGSSEE